jgi:hypothetical protein
MTEQTPGIPRVCLCGQPRSGTSMMMNMLYLGGLTIDYDDSYPIQLEIYNNPNGMYENQNMIRAGQFVNSFKLLNPAKLVLLPNDYKIIYISRNWTNVQASWQAIIDRAQNQYGYDMSTVSANMINHANNLKAAWDAYVPNLPVGTLKLDYDSVVKNPAQAIDSIAQHIEDQNVFPGFYFDQSMSATAIRKDLYTSNGRGA